MCNGTLTLKLTLLAAKDIGELRTELGAKLAKENGAFDIQHSLSFSCESELGELGELGGLERWYL